METSPMTIFVVTPAVITLIDLLICISAFRQVYLLVYVAQFTAL